MRAPRGRAHSRPGPRDAARAPGRRAGHRAPARPPRRDGGRSRPLRPRRAWGTARRFGCAPIVFLAGSDGAPELEPVDQPEAIRDLWVLSFRLPTEEDAGRSFAGVAHLASAVPAFRLRRSLALDVLDDHVAKVLDGV